MSKSASKKEKMDRVEEIMNDVSDKVSSLLKKLILNLSETILYFVLLRFI